MRKINLCNVQYVNFCFVAFTSEQREEWMKKMRPAHFVAQNFDLQLMINAMIVPVHK